MIPLSHEEVASLKHKIDARLAQGNLGQWEIQFLSEMRRRLDLYGTRTRMTDKQSAKLYALVNGASRMPTRNRLPFRRRHRSGFLGWANYRARRTAVMAGLLLAASCILWLSDHLSSFMPRSAGFEIRSDVSGTSVVGNIRVIDGDTVDVGGEHFRLIGLNTPETFSPRCNREYALGMRAKERLGELLAGGRPALTREPCACPPGTEGTDKCNYGRSCGTLTVNGADVADTLVGEGLAVEFHCGLTKCPPMPRPWCD